MTKNEKILEKAITFFINHEDNEPNSDFCKAIDSLIDLKQAIAVNGCCKSDSEQLLSLEDNKEDEYWNDYLNNQMSADQ